MPQERSEQGGNGEGVTMPQNKRKGLPARLPARPARNPLLFLQPCQLLPSPCQHATHRRNKAGELPIVPAYPCAAPRPYWGSLLTSFSPSPIHLETREEAEIEKNTAEMLVAIALPSIVLPVPGGPNSRMPLGGARAPCRERRQKEGQGMSTARCKQQAVGVEERPARNEWAQVTLPCTSR